MEPNEAIETTPPRVLVLIATIPARKNSCERLLGELARQTRKPDGVILVLDGYGEAPAPVCTTPVIATCRTEKLAGAGNRWVFAEESISTHLQPEDVIVCLDDDTILFEAPGLVAALVKSVETTGGAAAAMGRDAANKPAPPGIRSRGALIYGAANGFALRAKHLMGLSQFAEGIHTAGGPDALGLLGDDDAIVSAWLWKQGIAITHAPTGNIFSAPGMRSTSQTAEKIAQRHNPDAQKQEISRLSGWPWPGRAIAQSAMRR